VFRMYDCLTLAHRMRRTLTGATRIDRCRGFSCVLPCFTQILATRSLATSFTAKNLTSADRIPRQPEGGYFVSPFMVFAQSTLSQRQPVFQPVPLVVRVAESVTLITAWTFHRNAVRERDFDTRFGQRNGHDRNLSTIAFLSPADRSAFTGCYLSSFRSISSDFEKFR
jgi:hypothetical protein